MTAVFKRELRAHFHSMIGYVYVVIVQLFLGILFFATNLLPGYPYFAGALSSWILLIVLMFMVPILTMKSLAEERRQKTDQMIFTYPVSVTSVITGKFFAMLLVYAIPLIISGLCPLFIAWASAGGGSLLIDYSAIFAFLCLGALYVAIGMFISSLTDSQIIAAIASMGVLLLLFIWQDLVLLIPETPIASLVGLLLIVAAVLVILYNLTRSTVATAITGVAAGGGIIAVFAADSALFGGLITKILSVFSVRDVIGNFTSYLVFDLKGIILLLSFAALFVFLTIQSVQKRRWS